MCTMAERTLKMKKVICVNWLYCRSRGVTPVCEHITIHEYSKNEYAQCRLARCRVVDRKVECKEVKKNGNLGEEVESKVSL